MQVCLSCIVPMAGIVFMGPSRNLFEGSPCVVLCLFTVPCVCCINNATVLSCVLFFSSVYILVLRRAVPYVEATRNLPGYYVYMRTLYYFLCSSGTSCCMLHAVLELMSG